MPLMKAENSYLIGYINLILIDNEGTLRHKIFHKRLLLMGIIVE